MNYMMYRNENSGGATWNRRLRRDELTRISGATTPSSIKMPHYYMALFRAYLFSFYIEEEIRDPVEMLLHTLSSVAYPYLYPYLNSTLRTIHYTVQNSIK